MLYTGVAVTNGLIEVFVKDPTTTTVESGVVAEFIAGWGDIDGPVSVYVALGRSCAGGDGGRNARPVCPDEGAIIRIFRVIDACGNISTCEQIITLDR